MLAATLSAVGTVPVAGLALILGIDRFMSEARALTNFIGNSVATLVVAKWCKALDTEKLKAVLDNEPRMKPTSPSKCWMTRRNRRSRIARARFSSITERKQLAH